MRITIDIIRSCILITRDRGMNGIVLWAPIGLKEIKIEVTLYMSERDHIQYTGRSSWNSE